MISTLYLHEIVSGQFKQFWITIQLTRALKWNWNMIDLDNQGNLKSFGRRSLGEGD